MAGQTFVDQNSITDFVDQSSVTLFVDQGGDFLGGIFSGIICGAGSYTLTGQSMTMTTAGGVTPPTVILMPMACM